ncbi:DNA-directed RNA polymerase subunit omega [Ornithinibacillus gellani]|uniref:DNA-directed RNA polymerase subunit omega n=1 Tax=Ornithinibacillus gellani TaxID=2293253 RepID=UPI000F4809C0|nr:DNA-directed RNA polymerase subunit omega [Ornithinibacillus gellani]TQS75615.1 DNA-directed RNA polymerase subunit omega [Ornithinibacillus gellani]
MMLEPSIDALQEKIKSKYSLVTLSAKRARQIRDLHNGMLEHPKSVKFVGMALEEIQAEILTLEDDE